MGSDTHDKPQQQDDEHKKPQNCAAYTKQNLSTSMSTRTKDNVLTRIQPPAATLANEEAATNNKGGQGSNMSLSADYNGGSNMSHGSNEGSHNSNKNNKEQEQDGNNLPALKSGEVHVMYSGNWDRPGPAKPIVRKSKSAP